MTPSMKLRAAALLLGLLPALPFRAQTAPAVTSPRPATDAAKPPEETITLLAIRGAR